jgi:magnesium-transporting ATPase (P-type)
MLKWYNQVVEDPMLKSILLGAILLLLIAGVILFIHLRRRRRAATEVASVVPTVIAPSEIVVVPDEAEVERKPRRNFFKPIGRTLLRLVTIPFVLIIACWKYFSQKGDEANNLRAKFALVAMVIITVGSILYFVNQLNFRRDHPFSKEIANETLGQDHNSVLKSGYLPDPETIYGQGIASKQPLVNPPPKREGASAFWLGVWFFICLPILWVLAILYWIFSWREERLRDLKEILESIKRKRDVVRSYWKITAGQPAVVLGGFPTPVLATAGAAAAAPVASGKSKMESVVIKALAAEEVMEYALKFIGWALKKKGEVKK